MDNWQQITDGELGSDETAWEAPDGSQYAVRVVRGDCTGQTVQLLGRVRSLDDPDLELRPRSISVHKDGLAEGRVTIAGQIERVRQEALKRGHRQRTVEREIAALPADPETETEEQG